MPFIYVYSPTDFVGGLPNEAGSAAAGTAPFTLTLASGASPTVIEITDNDTSFDEVDGTQTLATTVTIDGSTYTAGTGVFQAYDLLNTTTGHKVSSIHFGGDGYQQGAVQGLVSTIPLVAGSSYTFDTERTSHNRNNQYSEYFACFMNGTRIKTDKGFKRVENLRVGDRIQTLDNGFEPLLSVLSRELSPEELQQKPNMRPVRICAGALGQGMPKRDVLTSPQHRFLGVSPIAKRMFGHKDTLIAAKKLTALPGIYVDETVRSLTYFHLVLENHEIVNAEGAPSESFYCGPFALKAMDQDVRDELIDLFPELATEGHVPPPARAIPSGKRQKTFIARHERNKKSLLAQAGLF